MRASSASRRLAMAGAPSGVSTQKVTSVHGCASVKRASEARISLLVNKKCW